MKDKKLLEDYVLGSELAEKGNFHIANISMLLNERNMVEGEDYLKFGGITLVNKETNKLPKYIGVLMFRKDNLDLSEYVPYTYMKETLENTIKLVSDKYTEEKFYGKKFIKPEGELKVLLYPKIVKTVVDIDEIEELERDNLIEGKLKLSKNKYLVWY